MLPQAVLVDLCNRDSIDQTWESLGGCVWDLSRMKTADTNVLKQNEPYRRYMAGNTYQYGA